MSCSSGFARKMARNGRVFVEDEEILSHLATIVVAWCMVAWINHGDWLTALALYLCILLCLKYGQDKTRQEPVPLWDVAQVDLPQERRSADEEEEKSDNTLILEWTARLLLAVALIEMLGFVWQFASGFGQALMCLALL